MRHLVSGPTDRISLAADDAVLSLISVVVVCVTAGLSLAFVYWLIRFFMAG